MTAERITNHTDYVDAKMFGTNSGANALLAVGVPALFVLPLPVNLGSLVLIGPALVMKKRSIEAYSKTMVALINGGDRGGESAQRLVIKTAGICSYSGIKAAFQTHFKDTWREEFMRLEFPPSIWVFASEDLKFIAKEIGLEVKRPETGKNIKAMKPLEKYPPRQLP